MWNSIDCGEEDEEEEEEEGGAIQEAIAPWNVQYRR